MKTPISRDRSKRRVYAVDDEEDTEGVACVACCAFDRIGATVGAISVTGLKQRGWNARRDLLARAVARHAERIWGLLGGSAALDGPMQKARRTS